MLKTKYIYGINEHSKINQEPLREPHTNSASRRTLTQIAGTFRVRQGSKDLLRSGSILLMQSFWASWSLKVRSRNSLFITLKGIIQHFLFIMLKGISQFSRSVMSDPTGCSMPGFPARHQLLEPTQTHVYPVGDAIQPSHPLSSPSLALSLSQHQVFF